MRSERRRQTHMRGVPRAHAQISAICGPFGVIQRASSRALARLKRSISPANKQQKTALRSKEHGACEVRCAKEISAMVRPNELVQKLTLVAHKERADDAPEAPAEQHEERATKTEQVVRRTSRPGARATMRRCDPSVPTGNLATLQIHSFPS